MTDRSDLRGFHVLTHMSSGRVNVLIMAKRVVTTTTRVQSAPKRKQQRRKRAVVTTTTTTLRRRGRRNRRFVYQPRSLPAASGARYHNRWSIRQSGGATYVTGTDLLNFDANRSAGVAGVFWTFPVNPVYWTGTQIAALASSFMSYRPMRIQVHYQPKVGTNTAGSVYFGTAFDKAVTSSNTPRMLTTSNGGFMTQVYNRATSNVRCGTSLPQNLYKIAGSPDDVDSNPFTMIAYTDANVAGAPGDFTISYVFKLANPGITAVFDNTGQVSKTIQKDVSGDDISDYTLINVPPAVDAAFTSLENLVHDGITYGAGTTFQLLKHGLRWGNSSMIPFKDLFDTITTHSILGVIYSYITGGS